MFSQGKAGPVDFGKGPQFVDTRLDTWKLIAHYLGRSSRTVQRWHAGYGLPVHHLGGDASSVYAYKDELDRWLRRRQGSIAEGGASKRSISLEGFNDRRIRVGPDRSEGSTVELEARQLVSDAQCLWEALSATNLNTIARMYRRAVDLDPLNSVAYAGFAQALIAQAVLGNLHPSAAYQAAAAALKRSLEINPELFEAVCASAMLKLFVDRDWERARELLDKALATHPGGSQAFVGRAFLAIAESNLEEARMLLQKAAVQRPLNTSIAELLCWIEYLAGRFESAAVLVADARETGHSGAVLETVEALCQVFLKGPESQIEALETSTNNSPRNYALLGVLGYAYGKTGRLSDARRSVESMTHMGLTGVYDFAYPMALTCLGISEPEAARKWLEQSYRQGSLWSIGFGSDPILAELRRNAKPGEFFCASNRGSDRPRFGEQVSKLLNAGARFSA